MRCPCCGATLLINQNTNMNYCEFCGHEEPVKTPEKVVERIVEVVPESLPDNLVIECTNGGTYGLGINIPSANISFTIHTNQRFTFRLPSGLHKVEFVCESITDAYHIVIPRSGEVCKIRCALQPPKMFDIKIDQPKIDIKGYEKLVNGKFPPARKLGIAAFIMIFIPILNFMSPFIGLVDIIASRSTGKKVNVFSILALVLGFLSWIFWAMILGMIGQS